MEQMPRLPLAINTPDTHREETSQRRGLLPWDRGEGGMTQSPLAAGPWERDMSCHKDVGHSQ